MGDSSGRVGGTKTEEGPKYRNRQIIQSVSNVN